MFRLRYTREYEVFDVHMGKTTKHLAYSKDEAAHQAGYRLSDIVTKRIRITKMNTAYRRRVRKGELWMTKYQLVRIMNYPQVMIVDCTEYREGGCRGTYVNLVKESVCDELIQRLETNY